MRYRGYYYDTETGWYYLQSRYYDPVVKRFINADSYLSTGQGAIGHNMFVYCNNNPVCLRDQSGGLPAHSTRVTDTGHASDRHKQRMKILAIKAKYNKRTINIFSYNEKGDAGVVSGKVNISFFTDSKKPSNSNIRIWNSYEISDPDEMKVIISVFMESKFYDADTFTHSAAEYFNEWQAHNYAYDIVSRGNPNCLDRFIMERAKHVDFNASDSRILWRYI